MVELFKERFRERGVLNESLFQTTHDFNLVLDLDETLVHYNHGDHSAKIHFRPHLQEFLEQVAKNFNLFIFTSSLKEYADTVIDYIDPKHVFFRQRFYRENTSPESGGVTKDLAKLGFDLRRTIIVDNIADNFSRNKENGILVDSFYSDPNDLTLKNILPLLDGIIEARPADVRVHLEA